MGCVAARGLNSLNCTAQLCYDIGQHAFQEDREKMDGLIFPIAFLILAMIIYVKRKKERALEVDAHVKNILKGGLIPRVEKEVHLAAMRKIGTENPNIKLPRREYY